ncbi:MAG TPA: hypothetical protein VEJ87_12180, partial [Acidimicrobiales bacterium]|nr:hypothetical protein [Acidimicrobiales bacterium]
MARRPGVVGQAPPNSEPPTASFDLIHALLTPVVQEVLQAYGHLDPAGACRGQKGAQMRKVLMLSAVAV